MKLDVYSEECLKKLHPDVATRFRIVADTMDTDHRLQMRMTEGLRTPETQMQYYAKGRTQLPNKIWKVTDPSKIITHALPFQSLHQFGLAFDACFVGRDPYPTEQAVWDAYGKALKQVGLTWGGDWLGAKRDMPHGEDKYGFTLVELKLLYLKNNNILDVWDACSERIAKS